MSCLVCDNPECEGAEDPEFCPYAMSLLDDDWDAGDQDPQEAAERRREAREAESRAALVEEFRQAERLIGSD